MAENAKIIITAEDNASAVFEKFGKTVDRARDKTENVNDAFKKVGATLTAIGAAGAFSIKALAESAGQFEQTKIAFGTLLGSAEAAEKKLKELSQFAAKTPFTLPGIETAAKQLLAYGVTQDQLIPELKKLGDIAAGVGIDKFPQLTLAYGQVRAATRLTGAELRQFTEAGVPLLDELAKQFGVTAAAVQTMVSDGSVSFESVSAALQNLTKDGGRFGNLMEKQSGSLLGQFSNLEDSLGLLARQLGEPLIEPLKELSGTIISIAQAVGQFVKEHPQIAEFAAKVILIGTAFALVAGPILLIVGFIPMIVAGFSAIATVATTLFAIIVSPWALVVAGIGLLVAAIVWLVNNWDLVKAKTMEVWGVITGFLSGVWSTITTAITVAWNAIKDFFSTIWDGIKVVFEFALALIVGLVITIFEKMGIDIVAVFTTITEWLQAFWDGLKAMWQIAGEAIKVVWNWMWGGISEIAGTVSTAITSRVTSFWNGLKGLFDRFSNMLKGVWTGMWDGFKNLTEAAAESVKNIVKGMVNWVIEKLNSLIRAINNVAQKGGSAVGLDVPNIPEIPMLAKGGIVTRPTLAMVGEAGPEAVVPLTGSARNAAAGIGGMTINITGTFLSEDSAEKVADMVIRQLKMHSAIV